MNRAFWKGKRIFLTGHTGFKGSWLSLWLQQNGAEVTGFSLEPSTTPSLFELARVGEGMSSLIADIRDYDRLLSAMKQVEPQIVFHLAAQSLVRESYRVPMETFAINVMGTIHVLNAVRQLPSVRSIVVVTSDKCYQNYEWTWGYRENDPMGGNDPYSASKGCAELAIASYRNSYFSDLDSVSLASARAGNVIGGGDYAPDRLVPDILSAVGSRKPVFIRNPNSIRPWQHVLEPLFGYLLLAEALYEHGKRYAKGWNFGPCDEDSQSVSWIAERLTHAFGKEASWETVNGPHPHEAASLKLDSSRARTVLGWKPKLTLANALDWIVEWTHAYTQNQDMRERTCYEIRRYESLG